MEFILFFYSPAIKLPVYALNQNELFILKMLIENEISGRFLWRIKYMSSGRSACITFTFICYAINGRNCRRNKHFYPALLFFDAKNRIPQQPLLHLVGCVIHFNNRLQKIDNRNKNLHLSTER